MSECEFALDELEDALTKNECKLVFSDSAGTVYDIPQGVKLGVAFVDEESERAKAYRAWVDGLREMAKKFRKLYESMDEYADA